MFKNDTDVILFFVILTLLVAIGVPAISFAVEKKMCFEKANIMELESRWNFFTGCVLVKPDGKKILLEQIREYGEVVK